MITVDSSSSIAPYEQVRSQIAARIRSGELADGQALPSIRQLAGDLRVSPGTVARAYSELEAAGLLQTDRRRGSRVRSDAVLSEGAALGRAVSRTVALAKQEGLSEADLVGMIASAWRGEQS